VRPSAGTTEANCAGAIYDLLAEREDPGWGSRCRLHGAPRPWQRGTGAVRPSSERRPRSTRGVDDLVGRL